MTTTRATAHLAEVDLPDFGVPPAIPEIPRHVYAERVGELRARAQDLQQLAGQESANAKAAHPNGVVDTLEAQNGVVHLALE